MLSLLAVLPRPQESQPLPALLATRGLPPWSVTQALHGLPLVCDAGLGLTQTGLEGPSFHCFLLLLSGQPPPLGVQDPTTPASSHSCPPWGPITDVSASKSPTPALGGAALRSSRKEEGEEKEGRHEWKEPVPLLPGLEE